MAALNLRNPNGYDGSPATQYKQGIVRLATDVEAAAGTTTNVAVTPAQLQASGAADFASPPVLGFGSTTPRPVATTKITIPTGANASLGTSAAMTAGAVTVANTSVTAASKIFCYPAVLGTVTAPQAYRISAIVAGTSFTITSADATDTSTWNYMIIS